MARGGDLARCDRLGNGRRRLRWEGLASLQPAGPIQVRDYGLGEGFWFTPPIAFLFYPFTVLPWPFFAAALTGASLVALGYLAGRWAAIALLVPFVWWEISAANVNLLIGAAIVAGFRYPAVWSFVLLTKVTPGVGLLWFAVRREWRSLRIALGATALVAAWSFAVAPNLWFTWADRLVANVGHPGPGYFTVAVPLLARLPVAVLLVVWGARTDRRWTVVVAAVVSVPEIWWNSLGMLVAVLPLVRSQQAKREPLVQGTRSKAAPPETAIGTASGTSVFG